MFSLYNFHMGQTSRAWIARGLAPLALAGASLGQAPVADFSTDPALPAEGVDALSLAFTDVSTGTITSWQWDFGDGATSTVQNPTHVFGPGEFDLSLTVTGPEGSDTLLLAHAVGVQESIFGFVGIPPSMKDLQVRQPEEIASFITNNDAAIALGKALFWDVQAGSDGLTACASCHYHAGADNRAQNSIHPGPDGVFGAANPNGRVDGAQFPFVQFATPELGDEMISMIDDIRGSQGVTSRTFAGINPMSSADDATDALDSTFNVGGINTMQVTGRDAPTNIGAAFMERLFWDGRAQGEFNGVNIWGSLDPDAAVLEMLEDGSLGETSVSIPASALASQSVGPPTSHVEMSWRGRGFADIGTKLIGRQPLSSQFVDPTDPVLGPMANLAGDGLDPATTYSDMIQAAFDPRWWGSAEVTAEGRSQMESNFSLFWGLSIQAYQQTLLPNNAPYDQFVEGDEFAMSDAAKRGLAIFQDKGKCIDCHSSPTFGGPVDTNILSAAGISFEGSLERMEMDTAYSVGGLSLSTNPGFGEQLLNFGPSQKILGIFDTGRNLIAWRRLPPIPACGPAAVRSLPLNLVGNMIPADTEFEANVTVITDGNCELTVRVDLSWNELGPPGANLFVAFAGGRIFRLQMPAPNTIAVYDDSFYNIGVTQTISDMGAGADGPFGPLSMTRRHLAGEEFDTGIGPVSPTERVAVDGSFKTSSLRNVELTGPFMHNGSMKSLEEVVEFYARGANFGNARNLAPDLGGFELTGTDKADLVAFMQALTDERVRNQSDVFAHPELPLKRGNMGDDLSVADDGTGNATPNLGVISATGAAGGTPVLPFDESL